MVDVYFHYDTLDKMTNAIRAAQTLPAHKIRCLEDVACKEGYCDCFREGYAQGIAERENTQCDDAAATRALREACCGLA